MTSSVVTRVLLFFPSAASVRAALKNFEVLPPSGLHSHSVRRRDVQTQTHLEKVLSFHALQRSEVTGGRGSEVRGHSPSIPSPSLLCFRHFRLYLRTNDQLFTQDFRALVVDQDGTERRLHVNPLNYFSGHVIGQHPESKQKLGPGTQDLLTCLLPAFQASRTLESKPTWTALSSPPTS